MRKAFKHTRPATAAILNLLLVARQAQEAAKASKPRTAEEYEAAISELNLRLTDLEAGKAKEEEARNYMQLERVRHLPLGLAACAMGSDII